MIINNHILKLSNVYYNKKFIINNIQLQKKDINKFIDNYEIGNHDTLDKNITNIDNMFIIPTLHSCFCHALIDNIFPYFWAINDIENVDNNFGDFLFFIKKKEVHQFSEQNLPLIDSNKGKYKGTFHDIISLVNNKYIFEHLTDSNTRYLIKNCYFYIGDDRWQRSPWNCIDNYPGRTITIQNVMFNDEVIKKQLNKFIEHVTVNFKTNSNNITKNGIVLLNRKSNIRNINNLLEPLLNILNKFENFNGVIYLENLTFKEQIQVFLNNTIIITPHGAGMIHNIWSSNKNVIEITFNNTGQNKMYKRICDITNNKIVQIEYQNIVNELPSLLNNV